MTGPLHYFEFDCVRSTGGRRFNRPYVDALYADFGKECGLIKAAPQSGFPQATCSIETNIGDLHET